MVAAGLLLALAACSAPGPPSPRALRPEADACEVCHMRVDDPRAAAQLVEPDGRVRMFDAAGCLVAWLDDHPRSAGAAFVSDAGGGGWLPAADAAWVAGGGASGMGGRLRAFRDRGAAEADARKSGGAVMGWNAARTLETDDAHAH
jgi:nitrous oxide reductase accessory protein NosL